MCKYRHIIHSSVRRFLHARSFCVWTDASLSGQQGRDVQSKRLEVLNTWREITQLEDEIKERLVSPGRSTAMQRQHRDLKVPRINSRLVLTVFAALTGSAGFSHYRSKIKRGSVTLKCTRLQFSRSVLSLLPDGDNEADSAKWLSEDDQQGKKFWPLPCCVVILKYKYSSSWRCYFLP